MADECTDITTIEELLVFCRWVKDGEPVEIFFFFFLPLKKADAQSIYSSLINWLKQRNIQISKLVDMGFDGAATFSSKKNWSSGKNEKELTTCYLCALSPSLASTSLRSGCHTEGIKHIYITLITLWKFFHYSPKRSVNLKEVQRVLNLPELKIFKPSHTRWLAHERGVKAVANYAAIVIILEKIYEQSHEPEALGISKAL